MPLENAAFEDSIAELAAAIQQAARTLGLQNAATEMGALEVVALEIKNGCAAIAEGLQAIAQAISEKE